MKNNPPTHLLQQALDAIKEHRDGIFGPEYDYGADGSYEPEAKLYRIIPKLEKALSAAANPAASRAQDIIKDILVNHLPRVQEGLEKGYIDENQILVIYDHAVRARILTEMSSAVNPNSKLKIKN